MIKILSIPTSQVVPGMTMVTVLGHKVVTADFLTATSKATLLIAAPVADLGMGVL